MRIVIGTRGSPLALWQAHWVKDQLLAAGYEVEIKTIKTTGDKLQNVSFGPTAGEAMAAGLAPDVAQAVAQTGTKGLFIKEIEEALAAGEVDVSVHSMKDLPTAQPPGLIVAAVPQREDARDVFISRDGARFADLSPGSVVGTSSLRRQSQLGALRPDVSVTPVRGNLDTRLRKLERGDFQAIVLAAAGVHRLGWKARITEYFRVEDMCPAVAQGALAIEIREGDLRVRKAVAPLNHPETHAAVHAERAMLRRLGGGCQVPIAAHACIEDGVLRLGGVVASLDGSRLIRAHAQGRIDDPEGLGTAVAEDLLKQGARAILAAIH